MGPPFAKTSRQGADIALRRPAQSARRPQTRTRLAGSIFLLSLSLGLASKAPAAEPARTARAGRTAVAIVLEDGELPEIEAMQTWFLSSLEATNGLYLTIGR